MPDYPRFGLFNTEARAIHSDIVGQDFQIGIWLPFSYGESERRYPVLYVPDGEYVYGVATGLTPTLIGAGEVPEVLVVGIAYQGIATWQEFGILRDRDLCPPGFQNPPAPSRIAEFTEFFKRELFPLVEGEYRGSPDDRALFGFSSGGLYAMHTLLTQPGMFRRTVAASCTWPGADSYLLGCEQRYANLPEHPPADLYLAVGGLDKEQLSGFRAVGEALRQREYAGLRLCTQIVESEGHSSGVIARAFVDGVRAVYKA